MSTIRITKIRKTEPVLKTEEPKVTISYLQTTDLEGEKISTETCKEEPAPSFYTAFSSLVLPVLELKNLDTVAWKESRINEISIEYIEDDYLKFDIRLNCKNVTQNSSDDFKFNSIYAKYVDKKFISCIDSICKEALKYIKGERAQLSLFSQESLEKEADKELAKV